MNGNWGIFINGKLTYEGFATYQKAERFVWKLDLSHTADVCIR
jgi:hypothetical protein